MPCADPTGTELAGEPFKHGHEFGDEDLGVLFHMLAQPVHVFEKFYMAKLVDLVIAEGLHAHLAQQEFDVVLARGKDRHARAGKRDLAGGHKFVNHVLRAVFPADVKYVQQMVVLVGEGVHEVGVVPENAEIVRRRLQGGEGAHRLVRIGDAGGV